jgi:methylthioribulose-1-phosphate dehydratase
MDGTVPAASAGTLDDAWNAAADEIVSAGRRMDGRGWVPATAGNISVRLADGRIAITRSGTHKGLMGPEAVMQVEPDGRATVPGERPSAETLLHCQLYARDPAIGAVVHGHSVAATVLSMQDPAPALEFSGYELLKAFQGQTTHETRLRLPLFDNDQDIARLATIVEPHLEECRLGYLIRGHGVYVWGPDMFTALARLEGLEFLLACRLEERKLPR